ncbi:unnamed protein product [Penicillium nalgiovense]|nr:unnamed protein product [Penicillium nalgiovense]
MDQFSTFVKFSAADRPSGSPHLTLTFEAKSVLNIEVEARYPITFTITREANDTQRQPCIIHWDPVEGGFGQQGIMLLRSNSPCTNKLQPLQVDLEKLRAKFLRPRELEVNASDPCFKELKPGVTVSWEVALPSVYFDSFHGGDFYYIFWSGGQIPLWDWGTLAEFQNRKLGPKSPAVILPAGPQQHLAIPAEESDIDDVGPLSPSPEPMVPLMSGAPVFSLSITGPATLSMKDRTQRSRLRYVVTATLSYDTAPDAFYGKSVIFHTFRFKDIDCRQNGFRLYFRERDKDEWGPHELGGLFTHHKYRFATIIPVNVGRNDRNGFVALAPGESWSFTREVTEFPQNAALGDKFRYGFKGALIDWWDWGHFQDHQDTVVGIYDRVYDPGDNGGRPELVVPSSNWVEFTLVE